MQTKLFVDDIRNAPDDSWIVARTITSAISAIYQMKPNVISLDHDISHQVAVGETSRPFPCEENFSAVAHFIAEYYNVDEPPEIIIHTSNPVGAENMIQILKDGGFAVHEVVRYGPANRLEMEV